MFSVRTAQESDLSIIQDLASQVWGATYGDILSEEQLSYMFDLMYSSESLKRQFLQDEYRYFIFYLDSDPVGYLAIEQKSESVFTIQKIYVIPAMQGRGLGRFVMNRAIEYVHSQCRMYPCTIELYVNRSNRAVDFYKHIGFQIEGERDFHVGNNFYMNDYIMTLIFESKD